MLDRLLTPLPTGSRLLAVNGALALAYYLTARLGMSLGIGPLHITAIWPPSGIALAGFMLLGTRALPGLAIGALATHYIDFFGPHLGSRHRGLEPVLEPLPQRRAASEKAAGERHRDAGTLVDEELPGERA